MWPIQLYAGQLLFSEDVAGKVQSVIRRERNWCKQLRPATAAHWYRPDHNDQLTGLFAQALL